jgi:hypothetical protein
VVAVEEGVVDIVAYLTFPVKMEKYSWVVVVEVERMLQDMIIVMVIG